MTPDAMKERTKEFALRAFGEGTGEGVKLTLCDAKGQVVQEEDNITRLHQFLVTLPQPSAGEAWSARLAKPSRVAMEDNYLLILGIPPLAATSREALLRPVK